MNCLEFRQRLAVEPNVRDPAFEAHARDCAACSRWASDAAHFEYRLHKAVNIDVPQNLPARILLRHEFRPSQRDEQRRRAFALAASILVAGILAGVLLWYESKPTLADDIFAHIDETSYSLTSTTILDDNMVAGVFRWFGADVSPELGVVSFANVCAFRDKRVAHVVLRETRSPVTVIFMPEERLENPSHIIKNDRSGWLLPYAGGSIAIVSDGEQRLDELEDRIRQSVQWPTSTPSSDSV